MLSIAKLRVGAEAYQLTGVAQSLDDYYSGAGEAAGWWAGTGAIVLGLDGEVAGDDLRAVLAGMQPGTGGLSPNNETIRPHPRRVPGFDLTFKAPKSASVLYAISDDPRVQGAIIDASEAALRGTLGWLEREVMAVRRGSDDRRYLANLDPGTAAVKAIRVEPGADLVAAVFRHRTSRAGDPLLHWHVLIPNMVRGADGRWSAFVHPDLYRLQRAAGEVFQAALRDELTQRLGVQWRPGRHVAEIAGIPQAVLDSFSKRSAEIDAWLDDHDRGHDPASRQQAVLATRRGKAEMEDERLDLGWKLEGATLGFGPEHAEALIAECHPIQTRHPQTWALPELSVGADGAPSTQAQTTSVEGWIADLLCTDLVTRDATFTVADLYQAVARRLGAGATVATVDRVAATVLASEQVLALAPRLRGDTTARWTSRPMAATERRLLDTFERRDTHHPIPTKHLEQALTTARTLGADQVAAVRAICATTDPVAVLIGPAGTGKTHTLATVGAAMRGAGMAPVGATPSARAAAELEAGTGIDASTLHSLARRWALPGHGPSPATVLIIDEAAMASTVDLEPLITRAVAAGGRVVLVGDHHQLPEIGPGGGLAAAVDRCRSVAELTVNRRQIEPWEHHALAQLRAGSIPAAVTAYRTHNRVHVTPDLESMLTVAVDRYLDALHVGQRPVLMAGTNDTVNRLNHHVRRRLADHQILDLDTPIATSHGRSLVVGDRVVLRRNARLTQPAADAVQVRNSDIATIVAAAPGGAIRVRRDNDDATFTVPADYLREGFVNHAYAVTAHRAQGGTWDTAIAVGVDGLYREAAYVQLSRGRHSNTLVIPQAQIDEIDAELTRHTHGIPLQGEEPNEPLENLIDKLQTSRAKLFALTRDPDADRVAVLADTHTVAELEARAARARSIELAATAAVGIDPEVLERAVDRAAHTARHVTIGTQIKAFDRHNIGTVTAIADTTATLTVRFTSHTGATAERTLPWTETRLVDRNLPPARILPAVAQHHLETLAQARDETLGRWDSHLGAHGVTAGDATRCERAAQLLVTREARRLGAIQPAWLTDQIGTRPATAHAATLWDDTVETIAHHRLRHAIPTRTPGLGTEPTPAHPEWERIRSQITAAGEHLEQLGRVEPQHLARTTEQLLERRDDLDAILATAPPDTRTLIDTLTSNSRQPTLLDVDAELQAALDTRDTRRTWILEHWPHVIERSEIDAALAPLQPDDPAHEQTLTVTHDLSVNLGSVPDQGDTLGMDLW
ncbi:MAG: relaxase domain-containing protein [Acidimicrobiales bacterium]|nr:relaxase domain-containing protein [Acidimicrobiales bacterium]